MDKMNNPDITQLLVDWQQGSNVAFNRLVEEVYPALKKIANSHMYSERASHTLQATAIVNEAYEKMVKLDQAWQDREHFLSLASRMMRHILVDYARAKQSQKRGGDWISVTFDEQLGLWDDDQVDILSLDQSLSKLADIDQAAADAIEKRLFVGMSNQEVAKSCEVSLATIERKIKFAKAWLYNDLHSAET